MLGYIQSKLTVTKQIEIFNGRRNVVHTKKRDLKLHKMQQPWPDGSSIKPIQMSNSCQSLNMRS